MKYGTVQGIDTPISRLVQGTMQVAINDDPVGFAQMDCAWEAGINCLDTAVVYGGNGGNDKFIGRWMEARNNRDQVVVLAKGAHHNDLRKRVTPYDIGSDLHDSLARLQTDYIDLYVLHRDDPSVPIGPIVDTLNAYVRQGKIRAFGGSNWSAARLAEANAYAASTGQIPFAVSSPNFSLADQLKEPWDGCVSISGPGRREERAAYAASGMALFTWSSMAGGFLSGRFTRDNGASFTGYFDKLAVECYGTEENFVRLDRAKELAAAKGVSVAQIALAYVLSYPLNIFAIVGSATADEVAGNVAAMNLELTEGEMGWLDLALTAPR